MRKSLMLVACLAILGAALACDSGAAAPTVTLIVSQPPATSQPNVIEVTATPAGATQAPTQTGEAQSPTQAAATSFPTIAPPTDQPTQAQPSFPSPTPIAPQPTSAGISRVKIYLVAVGDNGKSGPMIGCQDSIVAVDRDITPTRAPLQAALTELLGLKDEFFGQSGLRNALYGSDLTIDKVAIDETGLATINLSGKVSLAGECDDPRFAAQIEYTAKQFSTVKEVSVFINGQPMKELLSLK